MKVVKDCYERRINALEEDKKWKIDSALKEIKNFENGYSTCCLKNAINRLTELLEIETELEKYKEFLSYVEYFE